ncbi:hypothetical protein D9M71_327290 [compost metagenome]
MASLEHHALAAMAQLHPDRTGGLDQHPFDGGAGQYLEVAALQIRGEVGLGRAAALTVALGDLIHECAFLLGTVVVRGALDAIELGGLDKGSVQGARAGHLGDAQRTVLAMVVIVQAVVLFGLDEVRQHVGIRPALVALRCPVIVVVAVTTHIQHGVDRTGTAQGLAPWLIAATAVEARLHLGLEGPVVDPRGQHGNHAHRSMDQYAAVAAAGFDQADADARVFAEAAGDHTACRASSDDEVIEGAVDGVSGHVRCSVTCAGKGI